MLRTIVLMVLVWLPGSLAAAEYLEPARGTVTRQALMDAIRPHAEWHLGAPIEFVVDDLRVAGNVGFAALSPQRPGGAAIDVFQTPMYRRGQMEPEIQDGIYMHILYLKSGSTWVAVHYSVGATDVWFSDPEFCRDYRRVIPEYCQ